MNPIDDYAALRPEPHAPTQEDLDRLWDRALTADSSLVGGEQPRESANGRRRVAVLGAAASLIVGIAAIALVADRAEAPGGVANTAATSSPESSDPTASEQPTPAVDLTAPPTWMITEPGWVAAPPQVSFDPGVAAVTLVAGPEGVAASWVAIVDGVSDPLMSVGGLAADLLQRPSVLVPDETPDPVPTTAADVPSEPDPAIIAWRTDPAIGNFIVSAGGVAQSDAQAVFTAVQAGVELPSGFTVLPEDSGSLAQRRVTQRFDHPDGRWIEIDIQSGGQPRYDVVMEQATAAEGFDTPAGVDASNIAFLGESALLMRTGFWVSTVRTSASSAAATDFSDMIRLIELGEPEPADDLATTVPTTTSPPVGGPASDGVPSAIAQLAIGDSVMLGAANELVELGLTVGAVESRAFVNGLVLVQQLTEQDRLPETMVVQLGGNGPIDEQHLAEFADLVADVDAVIMLTSAIDRDYNQLNTELITEYAATRDNIRVLDWSELAASCPGDCFEADGFHLEPDGRDYYVMLIAAELDDPELDAGA
jgi:hypothetical protein